MFILVYSGTVTAERDTQRVIIPIFQSNCRPLSTGAYRNWAPEAEVFVGGLLCVEGQKVWKGRKVWKTCTVHDVSGAGKREVGSSCLLPIHPQPQKRHQRGRSAGGKREKNIREIRTSNLHHHHRHLHTPQQHLHSYISTFSRVGVAVHLARLATTPSAWIHSFTRLADTSPHPPGPIPPRNITRGAWSNQSLAHSACYETTTQ